LVAGENRDFKLVSKTKTKTKIETPKHKITESQICIIRVSTTPGNPGNLLEFKNPPGNPGNLLEFNGPPGNFCVR